MKNLYLTLLFILLLQPLVSQAQYVPFPEDNAHWTIESRAESDMWALNEWQFDIVGDTLVNSITYHKLEKIEGFLAGFPTYSRGYYGCFRNSVIDKKVYFMPSGSTNEQLLYDFNLTVGDTIYGHLQQKTVAWGGAGNICIIDSIDSVLVGGVYRKRWNYHSEPHGSGFDFRNSEKPCYIEGIGNKFGLFNGLTNSINYSINLVCHAANDTTLYGSTPCDVITAIEDVVSTKPTIHPNPFNDVIYLNNLKGIKSVAVYGLLGELQFKATAPNKNIDLGFLKKGIYFISITTQTGTTNQKIVKL